MAACTKIIFFAISLSVILVALQMRFFTIPIPTFILKLSLQERIFWQIKAAINTIVFATSSANLTRILSRITSGRLADDESIKSEDTVFDGVAVRIYLPATRRPNGPAILYFHGGGWSVGDLDVYDARVRVFARELRTVMVSLDYRLAPEHLYPAPLEDAFTALRHLMLHAKQWDVDPKRIAVMGDGAGGHLAAALGFRWRRLVLRSGGSDSAPSSPSPPAPSPSPAPERRLPPIRLQVLVYPATQLLNTSTVSFLVHRHDWLLTKATHTRNRVRALLGAGHADDELVFEAFYASNLTTSATRARLAPTFELWPSPPTTATGADATDATSDAKHGDGEQVVSGEANDVGALVSAEERELARRIREDPVEHHPTGDPELEKKLLPQLLDPEYSPLLAESFEMIPNAYVVTCGHDVLRDDGLLYVRRLRASKQVALVYHHHYPHVLLQFDPTATIERDLAAFLSTHPEAL